MSAPIFYHYLSSGEFVSDGLDGVEPGYEPKDADVVIKTLYQLDSLSDISVSSDEEEDGLLDTMSAMEERDLDGVPLPNMVWSSVRYKPSQVAQFTSLIQNKNYKLPWAAKEIGIVHDMAYQFNKQWKVNGGTVLPGYKLAFEVKSKRDNVKITDEQSRFIKDYVKAHPTYIVKDVNGKLCTDFDGLSTNKYTENWHITKKLFLPSLVLNQE
ncbi:unnamed protein product [Rhizopus stolonifer]